MVRKLAAWDWDCRHTDGKAFASVFIEKEFIVATGCRDASASVGHATEVQGKLQLQNKTTLGYE